MIRIFKVAICIAVTLMAVGCELEYDASENPLPNQPNEPGRPTVPLKKRPIVPTTKLPRPRAVENPEVNAHVIEDVDVVIVSDEF